MKNLKSIVLLMLVLSVAVFSLASCAVEDALNGIFIITDEAGDTLLVRLPKNAIGDQFAFTADADALTVTIELDTTGDFTFTNISTTTAYISGIEVVYEDAN